MLHPIPRTRQRMWKSEGERRSDRDGAGFGGDDAAADSSVGRGLPGGVEVGAGALDDVEVTGELSGHLGDG
jgi:hypothetical protein